MRYSPLALLVASVLAAGAAQAAVGTITFQGEVTDQTCEATINNEKDGLVELPLVSEKDFLKENDVAGETLFILSITGCVKPSDTKNKKDNIQLKLNLAKVSEKGNLLNDTNQDSAKGIAVQLLDSQKAVVNLKATKSIKVGTIDAEGNIANTTFTAQYVREGDITPGQVKTVVQYELNYL